MNGAVDCQPHRSHLSRCKYPFSAPTADVQNRVILEYDQGAIASSQKHPYAQQEQQHAGDGYKSGDIGCKGRRTSHDDTHEGQNKSKHPAIMPRTVTAIRSRTITIGCLVPSGSAWRHSSSARPNPSRYRSIPTPVHTPAISRGSFPSGTKISGSRIREKAIVKLPQRMQGSLLLCTGRSWDSSSGFWGAVSLLNGR